MKKFHPIRLIALIGFFVVFGFLFVLLFLNQIKSEIFGLISSYGYPAIFFITIVVELLAQPIGPEIPLLTGGILKINMVYVSLIVMLGSIIASLINYKIGNLFYPRLCKEKTCKKYTSFYKKYGRYGLLIASLGPVPYVPFCWFSGAFGMTMKRFFYFGVFPRILRIAFVSYIVFLLF